MPGGRPTNFNQEVIDMAEEYRTEGYKKDGSIIPSVAGLSLYINVARSTIYKWKEEEGKEAFSDILAKILSEQERLLLNKGLSGDFNSTITKLVLGKHGYSDKQETEMNGKIEGINVYIPQEED